MLVADQRAELLAAKAAGADIDLAAARKALDEELLEPPLSEITDPKQRVLRLLRGA